MRLAFKTGDFNRVNEMYTILSHARIHGPPIDPLDIKRQLELEFEITLGGT